MLLHTSQEPAGLITLLMLPTFCGGYDAMEAFRTERFCGRTAGVNGLNMMPGVSD